MQSHIKQNNIVVIGAMWGDEGKGKIIDYLTTDADAVVRVQGGHNAGHTIVVNDHKIVLHLLPSGVLHPHVKCFIAGGVVLSLEALFTELNLLNELNIDYKKRLFIANTCHLILPYHVALDVARESNNNAIGTTKRGIGPCYEDKIARRGIRLCDLLNDDENIILQKLKQNIHYYKFLLNNYHQVNDINFNLDDIYQQLYGYKSKIKSLAIDVVLALYGLNKNNSKIIFEGAQGALLDIDFGTYPYVTSSNCGIGGILTSSGIDPRAITKVMGVTKAYTTRVGNGPFPSELFDEIGTQIATIGKEIGATTNRPRRCGYLDLVALRYTIMVNGITSLSLMKLDILDNIAEIKICIAYLINNQKYDVLPSGVDLANCQAVYHTLSGWQQNTGSVTVYKDLPLQAREYIEYIETQLAVPIELISVGPNRNCTIIK